MSCLENKTKKTDLVTVKELFSDTKLGQNCFRIPDYQRGYAWDKQFKDLWFDILRVYNSGAKKTHYTGMLALQELNDIEKEKEMVDGTNAFYIVDGQQRLTSIVIILKALLEYICEESGENLEGNLFKLNFGVYRLSYSESRKDKSKDFFIKRIYNEEKSNDCVDTYLKNIDNAKNFVTEQLVGYDAEQAKEILNIVLNKLVFNIYFVTEGFDVRVTFETMNNRGKKLTNLELLKNRLMYLSTFIGKETTGTSQFENLLKVKINDSWREIFENLCYKEYQLSDDEYLQAHWIVYGSLDKSKGDSYIRDILDDKFSVDGGEFIALVNDKKFEEAHDYLANYVDSLKYYSRFWGIINNPVERQNLINDAKEFKYLDKLQRTSSTKFTKAVVMTICGAKELSSEQKCTLYSLLEQSIFLNRFIGQSKNDYSGIVKGARELINGSDKYKAYEGLKEIILNGELKVDKETVCTSFEKFGLHINDKDKFMYNWEGLRYFLFEYNNSLRVSTDDAKKVNWELLDKNSIEHILPQDSSRKYWQIVINQLSNDPEGIIRVTNSLGNLLLLSQGENSSVQNYSFPIKKECNISSNKFAYIYGSRSAQEVAEHDYWTLTDIYERQEALYKFMYDEWIDSKIIGMSHSEFSDLLLKCNLLIKKPKKLTMDEYKELDNLDLSNERNLLTRHDNTKTDDGWYGELFKYFVSKEYAIQWKPNNKHISHLDKKYTFVKNDEVLRCGFAENENKYAITFNFNDLNLEIRKNWQIVDFAEITDNSVHYFIKTFKRYLKRIHGIDQVNIIAPSFDDEDNEVLDTNRHHFKTVNFSSTLTNKQYLGKPSISGTLCIIDLTTNEEVPDHSTPSKKAIVRQAVEDLGVETTDDETLYQLYRKLSKIILTNNTL